MQRGSDRRKHFRARKSNAQTIRVSFEQKAGYPRAEIVATVMDVSEGGCRIKVTGPLGVGSAVYLDKGALFGTNKPETWVARVAWCSFDQDGTYSAGLVLEAPSKSSGSEGTPKPPPPKAIPDYYEEMQVNPKADPDTIHRIYRVLAQRLHPDNKDTGDDQAFRRLIEAYKILSDPEQRAAYDVKFAQQSQHRWKIFDQTTAMNGLGAEKAKRTAMLLVMYTRRRNEPTQPAVTIHDMEELLGCPKEHLEFGLWYLREKGFIVRSDNGKYAISAAGVEAAEESELPWAPRNRMLDAGPDMVAHVV
jgi:hypothetical protein